MPNLRCQGSRAPWSRADELTATADEYFGNCTNHGECGAVCPKQILIEFIGGMNRDLMRALAHRHREPLVIPAVRQQPFHEDSHEKVESAAQAA